jgi:DNA-binding NtrC family response regulator
MQIKILHDDNCPLGTNGLQAYAEARDAFSTMPPEVCNTEELREALAVAETELEEAQVCKCTPITLKEVERLVILETLKSLRGNRFETARNLSMGRTTLYRRLDQYGVKNGHQGRKKKKNS